MQLQKLNPDDLVVITLNVDVDSPNGTPDPEVVSKVEQTLRELNVSCTNYLSTTPMEEVLGELELFGLPAAVLFDRESNVSQRFDGDVDVAGVVAPTVQRMLGL